MRVIREQEWDGDRYDWQWTAPTGPFDGLIVPARRLVSDPAADIVAVWLDAHRKPIYLVGVDGEIYYHQKTYEILEQHFPARDFLRWLGPTETFSHDRRIIYTPSPQTNTTNTHQPLHPGGETR